MHTHSVGEDENNRSGQRNAWETGELGLYNVCMPVQEPEHKAPMLSSCTRDIFCGCFPHPACPRTAPGRRCRAALVPCYFV